MSDMRAANDYKCDCCNEKAVEFWPFNDPDIPRKPYCKPCLLVIKKEIRKLVKVCSK